MFFFYDCLQFYGIFFEEEVPCFFEVFFYSGNIVTHYGSFSQLPGKVDSFFLRDKELFFYR
jgi:hypothetical protein